MSLPRATAPGNVVFAFNLLVDALEAPAYASPPSGAAGGDLTGTYPNPTIAVGVVTGSKIAGGTIGTGNLNFTPIKSGDAAGGALAGTYPNPTLAAGATNPAISTVEVSLVTAPDAHRNGNFQITGLAGLTVGKPVSILQASGPYTGKGTRADEAELDLLSVSAKVLSTTAIQCYWEAKHRVRGNYKFDYWIGA